MDSTGACTKPVPEKIWVGPRFQETRILVLGESWYGDYPDALATDDGWIRAYLAGEVTDRMYTRIANACGLSPKDFWNAILFTNFVQRVGDARIDRPTTAMYASATERLARILIEHAVRGVWVLGTGQAAHSVPVIKSLGIKAEVSRHPTSWGLTNAALGASWHRLTARLQYPEDTAKRGQVPVQPEAAPTGDRRRVGMSRDSDPHQRRWLSLGYGGKTAPESTWRWWKVPGTEREWIICAPHRLAEFRLVHRTVYYEGRELFTARTQWEATWKALGYFYSELINSLPPPPMSP